MKEENIQEICSSYPNQLVLAGNLKMRIDHFTGYVAEQVLSGFVVFNSTDRREIALRMKELKKVFTKTACFYTGNILVGKRFWL